MEERWRPDLGVKLPVTQTLEAMQRRGQQSTVSQRGGSRVSNALQRQEQDEDLDVATRRELMTTSVHCYGKKLDGGQGREEWRWQSQATFGESFLLGMQTNRLLV